MKTSDTQSLARSRQLQRKAEYVHLTVIALSNALGRTRRACCARCYGRAVPDRDRTAMVSPLLRKPSAFTSERKLVAIGRLTGAIPGLQSIARIHHPVTVGIADEKTRAQRHTGQGL